MTQENARPERRREPRIEADLPLKIGSEDAAVITQTRNISTLGMYCQVETEIPPMTKVSLTLYAPVPGKGKNVVTRKVNCEGVVVRSEPVTEKDGSTRYNVAIYFSDLSEADRKAISLYVKHRL